jgi:TRAP-type C4-dicarboxylate transport system permease small subunit
MRTRTKGEVNMHGDGCFLDVLAIAALFFGGIAGVIRHGSLVVGHWIKNQKPKTKSTASALVVASVVGIATFAATSTTTSTVPFVDPSAPIDEIPFFISLFPNAFASHDNVLLAGMALAVMVVLVRFVDRTQKMPTWLHAALSPGLAFVASIAIGLERHQSAHQVLATGFVVSLVASSLRAGLVASVDQMRGPKTRPPQMAPTPKPQGET